MEVAPAVTCGNCEVALEPGASYCWNCGAPIAPHPDASAEIRWLTVLVCVLQGYDSLRGAALGEVSEALDRLVQRVEDHLGEVGALFAEDPEQPDVMLAIFGLRDPPPGGGGNQAALALRSAVELRALVRETSTLAWERAGHPLEARIGVDTGAVLVQEVEEGPQFLGTPLDVAARLAAEAQEDAILCTESTRGAAGGGFDLAREEPILVWPPAITLPTFRLKTRQQRWRSRRRQFLTGRAGRALIGRDTALDRARDLFDEVVTLRRLRRCHVTGPAGSGKSRFVAALTERLRSVHHGLDVARPAVPLPDGQAAPFGLLGELVSSLGDLDRAATPGEAQTRLQTFLDALPAEGAFPIHPYHQNWLRRLAHVDDAPKASRYPELARERCHRAVTELLRGVTRRGPLLVAIEGVSESDHDVLLALDRLSLDLADQPVLLLVTSELSLAGGEDDEAPLRLAEEIELEPVSADACRVILDQLLGRMGALSTAEGDTIARHVGGNPLFLEEIVSTLVETQQLSVDQATGRWTLDPGALADLPDSLAGAIAARIDRLSLPQAKVLRKAAIIGRTFWRQLIEELDEPQAGLVLAQLEDMGLIERTYRDRIPGATGFCFTHAVTREIARAAAWDDEIAGLHARIARWLAVHAGERFEPWLAAIATHFAAAGDNTRAVPYYMQAGAWSLALGDVAQAAHQFGRAKALAETVEVATEASIELAEALFCCARFQEAREHAHEVGEWAASRDDVRLGLRCLVLATRIDSELGEHAGAAEKAARALEVASTLGATRERGLLLIELAQVRLAHGAEAGALETAGDAESCFAEVGDRLGQLRATMEAARPLLHAGQFTRARIAFDEIQRAATERHHWVLVERARHGLAWVDLVCGNEKRAERAFRAGTAVFARTGLSRLQVSALLGLALTQLAFDRFEPAMNLASQALATAERRGMGVLNQLARAVIGHVLETAEAFAHDVDREVLLPAGRAALEVGYPTLLAEAQAALVDAECPRLYRVLPALFRAEYLARTEPGAATARAAAEVTAKLLDGFESCTLLDRLDRATKRLS